MAELIGTKEAAQILGVSEVTVWRRVKDGKLQPISKLGKQAIFSREYIEQEAAQRTKRQTAA
jgi:excisionase family DNA binding protein